MHLTLLSRSSAIYTTRRLADAARVAGHRVRVLNPLTCVVVLHGGSAELLHGGRLVPCTDVCIPRIAQSVQQHGLAVLDQYARKGVPVLNAAEAIARSRNKLRCLQLLSAQGIRVPATVLASEARSVRELIARVGGCPVLVKLVQGNAGMGVMVCETMQSMEAALEALWGLGHDLLVQQYVPGSRGRDLRALVVGGRVLAAVRRVPAVGRLRRTLGAGARFEPVKLSRDLAGVAERAARLVGLEVAAVDLLELSEGPAVFEVNSSPGIQDLESVTGLDVAGAIVARAVELAREGRLARRAARAAAGAEREAGAARLPAQAAGRVTGRS